MHFNIVVIVRDFVARVMLSLSKMIFVLYTAFVKRIVLTVSNALYKSAVVVLVVVPGRSHVGSRFTKEEPKDVCHTYCSCC